MQHEYFKVINYEDALELIRQALPVRRTERLDLGRCRGRILAGDLFSPEALPAFARSSVDGYALRAEDSYGASESLPAILEQTGEVVMGRESVNPVEPGGCAWIPTGGMLPPDCDSVVMVEHTDKLAERTILVHRPVSPGENLMLAGEDVGAGQLLFASGHVLRAVDIGLLAALGITRADVCGQYRIGIVSSGDEVVDINERPLPGQVRDVNSLALAAAVESGGEKAAIYPRVPDDAGLLAATIGRAQQECDLVFMSGGSSIGVKDMSLQVLMELPRAQLLFHGLSLKPGKPTIAVQSRDGLVIGLPGHPVAALMVYYVLCRPVLDPRPGAFIDGFLAENYASQAGRDDFVPVRLEMKGASYQVKPLLGKSGLISILARADGFMHVERTAQGIAKGSVVRAFLFDQETYLNK